MIKYPLKTYREGNELFFFKNKSTAKDNSKTTNPLRKFSSYSVGTEEGGGRYTQDIS